MAPLLAPSWVYNTMHNYDIQNQLRARPAIHTTRRRHLSLTTRLIDYLRLRYYQYEVTFGLYMMTPVEKVILNTIFLIILGGLMYGLWFGLKGFLVNLLCRSVYYITGSVESAMGLCA